MACFHTAEFYQASVINFQETSSQGNMLNQSLLMKSAKARMWKLYRTNNKQITRGRKEEAVETETSETIQPVTLYSPCLDGVS